MGSPNPKVMHKRVLVAEDEDIFRIQLVKVLESDGYQVTAVANGRAARDLFATQPFDLVISDISMPDSDVDGHDLLDFIKGKSDTKVILMTGYAYPSSFQKLSSFHPDTLLLKPFRKDDLKSAIERCLAPPETRRIRLTPAEQAGLEEVVLKPEDLNPQYRMEILVEAGEGVYDILCDAHEPLPATKILSLQRLGIKLWHR